VTAERLLEQDGLADLSLRNVARVAGVSHTAPYRHFRDKTGLFSALAQVGFKRLAEGMHAARSRNPRDPVMQLREAGLTYVTLAVDHPELTNLMFGGILKADQDPELQTACDDAFGALMFIVENGQKAGIYKDRETNDLALTAWAAVHGLAMLIIGGKLTEATKLEIPLENLTDTVGELLLFGMLK